MESAACAVETMGVTEVYALFLYVSAGLEEQLGLHLGVFFIVFSVAVSGSIVGEYAVKDNTLKAAHTLSLLGSPAAGVIVINAYADSAHARVKGKVDLYLNAAFNSLFRKLTGVFLRNSSLDNVIFSQLGSIFRRSVTENEDLASASAAADFFSFLDVGDKEKFCSQTLQKSEGKLEGKPEAGLPDYMKPKLMQFKI